MTSTQTTNIFCEFDTFVNLRLSPREMNPRKYGTKTLDLKNTKRQNQNLKANMMAGNRPFCNCNKCNPDTGVKYDYIVF